MKTFKLFIETTILPDTHTLYLKDKLKKDISKKFNSKIKKRRLTDKSTNENIPTVQNSVKRIKKGYAL